MYTFIRTKHPIPGVLKCFMLFAALLTGLAGAAGAQPLRPHGDVEIPALAPLPVGQAKGKSPKLINKIAVDKNTGAPLTGPILPGTEIKYIVDFDPPGTGVVYPSVSITDTMSSGLTYVPSSLQMPPGWVSTPTSPFTPPPTNVFSALQFGSEPGFTLPVSSATSGSGIGSGDGYTPVIIGNKVFGIHHHNSTLASSSGMPTGGVHCWNKDMTPCMASPIAGSATAVFIRHALDNSGKFYFPVERGAGLIANSFGIACYDGVAGAPCATPFTSIAASAGTFVGTQDRMAGVVSFSDNPMRVYSLLNNTVYCSDLPNATCSGFPLNGVTLTASGSAVYKDLLADSDSHNLYVSAVGGKLHCLTPIGATCTGWSASGASYVSTGTYATLSPVLTAIGTVSGVCVHGWSGSSSSVNCFNSAGTPATTVSAALSAQLSGARVVSTAYRPMAVPIINPLATTVLYPSMDSSMGKAFCISWASGLPTTCSSSWPSSWASTITSSRIALRDYGYMADPANSACIFGLGDAGKLFKFQLATGVEGCNNSQSWPVANPETMFCDGKTHDIQWANISIIGRPANLTGGTITVKNGSTTLMTITVTAGNTYPISSIPYAGNQTLTVVFNPTYSGSPPTTDYSLYVSFTSNANAQICYLAKTSCAADGYKNTATVRAPIVVVPHNGTTTPKAGVIGGQVGPLKYAFSDTSVSLLDAASCDDPSGGGVTSQPCCDKATVTPTANINDTRSLRHFTIFNTKDPFSPICYVDINVNGSGAGVTNGPPPGGWNGGDAQVDGLQIGIVGPGGFYMPYKRIPGVGNLTGQAASGGAPAVSFYLGIDKSGPSAGYSGTVTLTIHHCDGSACTITYGPWVIDPNSNFRIAPSAGAPLLIQANGAANAQFLPLSIRTGVGVTSARYVTVQAEGGTHEVFAASGPTPTMQTVKGGAGVMFDLGAPGPMDRAAAGGGEMNVVLRARDAARGAMPTLRWIAYDKSMKEIGWGTSTPGR